MTTMSNQVQQFHSEEFGQLEILMIGDKPYFPATECARTLGYVNPRKAILDHCKGVTKRDSLSNGGTQERNFIPEGDVYRLIIRSKLPAAERFERWVFDEVLPSIRKHGAYINPEILEEMLRNSEFTASLLDELRVEQNKCAAYEELAMELAPKALYCDLVLQSENTIPVSIIAKDYGMTAASFNSLLNDLGIQFKIGNTWLLYKPYANKGYTATHTYYVDGKKASMHTRWTQKGRLFLYRELLEYGIVPIAASIANMVGK